MYPVCWCSILKISARVISFPWISTDKESRVVVDFACREVHNNRVAMQDQNNDRAVVRVDWLKSIGRCLNRWKTGSWARTRAEDEWVKRYQGGPCNERAELASSSTSRTHKKLVEDTSCPAVLSQCPALNIGASCRLDMNNSHWLSTNSKRIIPTTPRGLFYKIMEGMSRINPSKNIVLPTRKRCFKTSETKFSLLDYPKKIYRCFLANQPRWLHIWDNTSSAQIFPSIGIPATIS